MRFTVRRYNSVPVTEREDIPEKELGNGPGRPSKSCKDLWHRQHTLEEEEDSPGPHVKISPEHLGAGSSVSFSTLTATSQLNSQHRVSLDPVASRGREFAKRQRQRLVFKEGECNISNTRVSERKRKYLVDIFTTFMEMKWRYNLILFGLGFITSWLVFAFFWWLVCYLHEDHLHKDEDGWQPCVANVYDFRTALLFSIETQHTIGYGFRAAEPSCPETVLLLMAQSVFGVLIQSLMTGVIFAKLSRPKRRAATLMFSRNAVICQRDGELCLLFRVADMRKSHIVQTVIRAVLVRNKLTKEGELIPLCQFPLDLQTETSRPDMDAYLFLAWPVTVTHHINEKSPLWEISAEQLVSEHFEIIVIFEGTVESTGMTTQVRTSYLPSEILWGHRLSPLMTFQKENGQYKIDHTLFHSTIPVETPEVSAKELAQRESNEHPRPEVEYTYPSNFTCPAVTPRMYTAPGVFKRVRASLKRKMSERGGRRRKPAVDASDSISTSLNGSVSDLNRVLTRKDMMENKKDSADSGFDPGTPSSTDLKEMATCSEIRRN